MTEHFQPPKRLFRYFSPRHSRLFIDQKLWFSTAQDFNDIFEVVPRYDDLVPRLVEEGMKVTYAFTDQAVVPNWHAYRKALEKANKELIDECNETFPDGFQAKFSEHFGILCFSEHLDSLLMWGHYTDCHKGFAVEFDPRHTLFTVRDFGKVTYPTTRPFVEQKEKMLLMKSPEWEYEAEHRLIKPHHELVPETSEAAGVKKTRYYLRLPMDSVKAIYFGCRMDAKIRRDLLTPLDSFPQIQSFFMRRNQTAYKLDPIPWKDWKEPKHDAIQDFNALWGSVGL